MPLFIDRLPFHFWTDPTRSPPLSYWTVVLPVMVTEPSLTGPPPVAQIQNWALDTGNRGEALAWRHHLEMAGLDPDRSRLPQPMIIRTVTGKLQVPVRDVDLWLVSNLPVSSPDPYRLVLHRGLPFLDVPTLPDPEFQRPPIGVRAMRSAGLRVEIHFGDDTVSVWTPDVIP
jgi:hypothetical protein